jgi:hypothetical protein
MCALDRNPQAARGLFPLGAETVEKKGLAQVGLHEQLTTENFPMDFPLT